MSKAGSGADLPQGTVTFLFTDIEGSTRMLQELGESYADVLIEHRRVLREAFERNNGVEVGTEGDSFFVAFARAGDAARAAVEGQRALAGGPVKVRMGLHTGEPQIVAGDYVGIDVHRAARISSAAHGGQVVASERTRTFLDQTFEVSDLGLHRLKDLAAPEKLFQLGPGVFPPLRSLNATNLPTHMSPLIGRTQEIAEITALLAERRAVTLTGPGGTGKTRLALQAAAEVVERFTDGVYWVPLGAVLDPDLVLTTIRDVFGTELPLPDHIGEKNMLLLLDNMEHLLDAAPDLSRLLAACPNERLLITSRAPLRIEGEREYAVEPLPDADAVALFRERAANAEPEGAVIEICRRVDRLPLAIELAAARTRIFPPTELLERLQQRLPLLVGGRRDQPERQRTLRATIGWSHDLLDADSQKLFARLSVFVGSFDYEAAEAVCDADFDVLESLLEASLLRQREGRFSMLDTIREFAAERLETEGSEALNLRHANYFLDLAERAAPELEGNDVGAWLRRVNVEEDNVRAALAWLIDTEQAEKALRLCIALTDIWEMDSHLEEGVRWFERALSLPAEVEPPLRALGLREYGTLLLFTNRVEPALAPLEESVASWRRIGDRHGLSGALRALGSALTGYDFARAHEALEEALAIAETTNDKMGERRVLHLLGEMLRDEGRPDEGARLLERSITIARELGNHIAAGASIHSLADLELDRGDVDRAEAFYRDCLRNAVELGLERHKVYSLAGLAATAAERGDRARASTLWRSVVRAEEELDFRLLYYERARYERHVGDDIVENGEAPTMDEAIELAMASLPPAGSHP